MNIKWIKFPLTELETCKKYVNTFDYQQENNVSVDDFLNHIDREYPDEILFDVFIRGNQEARIILSETNDYDLMEPLYEIGKCRIYYSWLLLDTHHRFFFVYSVIGSNNNNFSAIYRNNNECLEETYTPDVLWSEQFRKFTIQVTHGMIASQKIDFDRFSAKMKTNLFSNHFSRQCPRLYCSLYAINRSIEFAANLYKLHSLFGNQNWF